jgi:hypothetical protein
MLKSIKQFVESTIEDVEKQDWEPLFRNWYNNNACLTEGDNQEYLNMLFDILRVAYPDIEEQTLAARRQIIVEQFMHYIHLRMKNSRASTATYFAAESTLLMNLGLTDELPQLFKDAAVQCGFGPVLTIDLRRN